MDFQTLKKQLDSGVRQKFYIFAGDEREVMAKYIQRIADGDPVVSLTSLEKALPLVTARSLFKNSRTVYVVANDKEITDKIVVEDLVRVTSNIANVLIIRIDEVDNRKKFFKDAKDLIVEFKRFTPAQLVNYVLNRATVEFTERLAEILAEYCGGDVARIETEVDKFNALGQPVTLELLNELVHVPPEDRVFDMVDAVVRGNKGEAFAMYRDLLELKESPIKLLSLLYTKIKQVFLVQSYASEDTKAITEKTGLNGWQIAKARDCIGAHGSDDLLDMLRKVQRMEVAVKTGLVEQYVGFENLLVDLLK